jgi:phosphoribosylformylglycinamidine (FGAM) synthase-like amidotransferase family enzyme
VLKFVCGVISGEDGEVTVVHGEGTETPESEWGERVSGEREVVLKYEREREREREFLFSVWIKMKLMVSLGLGTFETWRM